MDQPFQRHVAVKLRIINILEGVFIQDEQLSYLLHKTQKVFRVNILATVLEKESIGAITNLVVDDGTGKMNLRLFEEIPGIEKIEMGTVVLAIGKVRVYNDEKYISPEIIKMISPLWLKVRSMEAPFTAQISTAVHGEDEKMLLSKTAAGEINVEVVETDHRTIGEEEIEIRGGGQAQDILPAQKIMLLIKELDKGDGALIEEVITQSLINDTEKLLKKMMEKGDIFQITPGKVKVL